MKMSNFWTWVKGNKKREKLYFIIDDKDDFFLHQDVKQQVEKLKEEKIQSFGLTSINTDFLHSKEEDLTLSRILLSDNTKTPFYFKISMYQIVEPKNFRLTLIFTTKQKIKRYKCIEATTKDIESLWEHLILRKELSEYNFNKWSDESAWYKEYLQVRKKQEEKELQHPTLLRDVFWNFSENRFKNKETFIQAVYDYHKSINEKWNSEENIKAPLELIVFYPYWKDDKQKTGKMTLKSSKPWTKTDLLFAIHNKCVSKIQNNDNHFMEGLTYHNHTKEGIATYFLNLGS